MGKKIKEIKVLLLSYDNNSGAGRLSERIYNSISKNVKCDYQYLVNYKKKILNIGKINSSKIFNYIKRKINGLLFKLTLNNNPYFKSPSIFPSNLSDEINKSNYDIVHISWINEFLSIEDLGRIKKPIVWSVCDMWPFTGYLHYCDYGKNSDWRKKNFKKSSFNFNKFNINRKLKNWKDSNITMVAPCSWMVNCLKDSIVFHESKIFKIPHPVNQTVFKPLNKNNLRSKYKLPKNKTLILFNCHRGINDERKGWKYFEEANKLTYSKYEIVVIGQKKIENYNDSKRKIHWFGKIEDEKKVSEIMNCVDLVTIPSQIDNLPQVGLEAQSCGKPVVTFNTNGLCDLVEHKTDGYLAKTKNVSDLAKGIDWIIKNNTKRKISIKCLKKAKKLYNSSTISKQYLNLYNKILKKK